MGNSFWSMVSGFGELVMRVFLGKAVYMYAGVEVLYFVEPAAWAGALLLVAIPYLWYRKRLFDK